MRIAIITGASSGIGREFCKQLDSSGFDEIWGVALEKEGLKSLANEMKTKVRCFALDLTCEEDIKNLESEIEKLSYDVSLLINCSGYGKFGRYDEIPVMQSMNMIDLNCNALVRLCEDVIPHIERGGNIINIASVAGFQPVPYLNVYGATKAFVLSYSRSLREEVKSRGINVTTVCPFWTKTEFFTRANQTNDSVVSRYVVMYSASDVVKKALRDTAKKKELSIFGFKAKMQVLLVKMLPHNLIKKFWIWQQNLHKKYK